jgi:pimeloyl-ACP methyl ester carboxylesterase
MSTKQKYIKASVTSKDGTIIGYRQMGNGPGLILLHGGFNTSQHMMKLGTALSDEFTVYIPDRRGRGLSGPFGDNYSLQKEDEDLDAILKKTDSHYVFGTADGALFALHAAISLKAIQKVFAFEPVLFVGQPGVEEFKELLARFEKKVDEDKLADAMVVLTKGANIKFINYLIPDFILEEIFKLYLWNEDRKATGDDVSGRELLPLANYEFQLVQETEGTIDDYKNVSAEVLLLNSTNSTPLIECTNIELDKVIPNSKHIELKGINHDSAQNYGKPEIIAQEIKRFINSN